MNKNRLPLFGGGLVRINAPALIERYNACLGEIGIAPTLLTDIHIDGMGWSPEVAAEKNERYYLSFGASNPFAIIVTPDQYLLPVYFPSHSYDWALMKMFFRAARDAITDITSQAGIWLDIDDEITEYRGLVDLLMVDHIVIRPNAPGDIMKAATNQRALVMDLAKDDNWTDPSFRAQVIESGKKFGDLRFRSLVIRDVHFSDVRSYHTEAFGGTYVFRDLPKRKRLIVMEDAEQFKAMKSEITETYFVHDEALISILLEEELVSADVEWYMNHPEDTKQKCEFLLADVVFENDPEREFVKLNSAQKKQLAVEMQRKKLLPEEYSGLERFSKLIHAGDDAELFANTKTPVLQKLLLRPVASLAESVSVVVWKLLSRMEPRDIVRLYAYDKNAFLNAYNTWPANKQRYAASVLNRVI